MAFRALKPVMQHPRCINCHGVYGDLFENRATAHPGGHIPLDFFQKPTIPCGECHEGATNVWELAPGKMFFTNKNDADLCFRLKQKGNGIELLNHFAEDPRILLAFQGKRGHNVPAAPPPISHDEFLKRAEAWVAAIYRSTSQEAWSQEYPGNFDSKCGCEAQENPTPRVDQLVAALQGLPQCPGMQLGPACFQKFSVDKSGLAASTSLAREPAAGSERTDVKLIDWLDQATASRNFKSSYDARKEKKMSPRSAFESFAIAGQADSGALEVWLDSNFGGESKEAGRAFGVFICGRVVGELKMFIAAGVRGATGQALVDATKTQMKGLLERIGSAVRGSGACA